MDDVSKHQSIVDVSLDTLELVREVGLACTRECFDDLCRWDQDVRLNYYHAGLRELSICISRAFVIKQQMKLVLLTECTDDADCITSFNPELQCPSAHKRHSEQYRTLDESHQDWLSILVHWRA